MRLKDKSFYFFGCIFAASQLVYSYSWTGTTSWLVLLGLIFTQFFLQMGLLNLQKSRSQFWFLIAIGLISRLLILGTEPWLEDDHYRYFWDGHVQNQGISPYLHPPNSPDLDSIDTHYRHLINYPEVPTVYPTIAQMAFQFLNWISPASHLAFQLFYLLLDLLLLTLLWSRKKLSKSFLIYWISPFILKEFYNSIHIDFLLLFLFFLSTVWIRNWKNSMFISLAAAIKVFPLMFLLTDLFHNRSKILISVFVPLLTLALLFAYDPSLLLIFHGISQFTKYWTFNDSFFYFLSLAISDQPTARFLTWFFFTCTAVWLCIKIPQRVERRTYLTAALFLFSPVLNPWYFCWVIPFLCFKPNYLLYSLGLPLYLGYGFFVNSEYYFAVKNFQASWILLIFILLFKKQISSKGFFFKSGKSKSFPG